MQFYKIKYKRLIIKIVFAILKHDDLITKYLGNIMLTISHWSFYQTFVPNFKIIVVNNVVIIKIKNVTN